MAKHVAAVVLAAGESRRMGVSKLLLPWGETTVLGQTLTHLQESQVDEILLVSGHRAEKVAAIAQPFEVEVVYNEAYAEGEMLSSLQVGVGHLSADVDAVLVILADQPLVRAEVIDRLLAAYDSGKGELIAPTYQGTRGNPVLIGRPYFAELLALPWGQAPRELLRRHPAALYLLPVESSAILQDLDRPEQYQRHRPAQP